MLLKMHFKIDNKLKALAETKIISYSRYNDTLIKYINIY